MRAQPFPVLAEQDLIHKIAFRAIGQQKPAFRDLPDLVFDADGRREPAKEQATRFEYSPRSVKHRVKMIVGKSEMQHGAADDDVAKSIRERHGFDGFKMKIFRGDLRSERSRQAANGRDGSLIGIGSEYFVTIGFCLAEQIDEVAASPTAGIHNSHSGRNTAPKNLIKEVDIDFAELFLNVRGQHSTMIEDFREPSAGVARTTVRSHRMQRLFICLSLALGAAFGQSAEPPVFDVASIKPSDPLGHSMSIGVRPGGLFNASGVTVKALIMNAYDLRPFQISGGPGWLDTDRYDIIARAKVMTSQEDDPAKMTDTQRNQFRAQMQLRLQTLLADRFQLKVHKETKDLPIYALTVAKNGAKIQESADKTSPGGSLSLNSGESGRMEMTGKMLPMESLVKTLAGQVGRTVLDKTGLQGKYDFKLSFTPDLGPQQGPGEEHAATLDAGPSIFTALQDQLGLKLDSQKGPVEVLVIDSVQKASEN